VTHPRAKLTVQGRLLLVQRVLEQGWSVPMAADAQGCSSATGYKWIRRFLAEGIQGLTDRSSRPHRCPTRLSPARERAILRRREATLEGPHRIAWALGEAPGPCTGCSGGEVHRCFETSIARAARSFVTNGSVRVSSCTLTSRSKAGSPRVVGGAHTVEQASLAPSGTEATVMTSSMRRSMTAPASHTQRSWPMSARRPLRRS
jgi:hypothetical protein